MDNALSITADLSLAIERHSAVLRRVLAAIFVYAGLADDTRAAQQLLAAGGGPARAFAVLCDPSAISRRTHRLIRLMLLPAESAVRRLIVAIAAQLPAPALKPWELKRLARPAPVTRRLPRSWEAGVMVPQFLFAPPKRAQKPPQNMPRFALFDPPKRYFRKRRASGRAVPCVSIPGVTRRRNIRLRKPQTPYDQISDAPLMRRIAAISAALDDLPRQARRLARWRAMRDAAVRLGRRMSHRVPLRLGRPPGSPALKLPSGRQSESQIVLGECDWLARDTVSRQPADTSS